MHPLQSLIALERWAGLNIAHNLKYVPADKFSWKPAPDAKSVQEIVSEVVGATGFFFHTFTQTAPAVTPEVIVDIASAQDAVVKISEQYAAFLETVGPQDLEGEITMMELSFPRAQAISMAVVEAIHHHGQIAYLQTMWGDTDSHFYQMEK